MTGSRVGPLKGLGMGWVCWDVVTGLSMGGSGEASVSSTAVFEDAVAASAAGGRARRARLTAAVDTGAPSFFTATFAFDAGAAFVFATGTSFFAAGFCAAGFCAAGFLAGGFFAAG